MGQQQRPRNTELDTRTSNHQQQPIKAAQEAAETEEEGDGAGEECAHTDLVQIPWFHQQWSVQCRCWCQTNPSASWQHLPPSSPTHAPDPLRTPNIHAFTCVPCTLDTQWDRTHD